MKSDKELMEFARSFWDPRLPDPTDGQIADLLGRLTSWERERLWALLEDRRRTRIRHMARMDQIHAELQQMLEF